MLIGLYSKRSRGDVYAAREYIKRSGFEDNLEGMRWSRKALLDLPEGQVGEEGDTDARFLYGIDMPRFVISCP